MAGRRQGLCQNVSLRESPSDFLKKKRRGAYCTCSCKLLEMRHSGQKNVASLRSEDFHNAFKDNLKTPTYLTQRDGQSHKHGRKCNNTFFHPELLSFAALKLTKCTPIVASHRVAVWRCGRYWMSFKSILYGIISHQCKNDGLFLLFTESFIATSLWSLPLCNPDSPRFLPTFHRIVTAEQYFPWLLKDISIRWKTVWISDAVGQKELEALNTDSTVEGGGGPYRLVCIPLVKSFNQFSPGFTWTHCTFLCTGCVLPVLSVTR